MAALYDKLKTLVLPEDKLELFRLPQRDPGYPGEVRRRPPKVCSCHGTSYSACAYARQRCEPKRDFEGAYECFRCKTWYRVDKFGVPLAYSGACCHHPGNPLLSVYQCCLKVEHSRGCRTNAYHVQRGDKLLANYTGYVETSPKEHLEPNEHGVFAIDCEMCYTTVGFELVTVTVLGSEMQVVYDQKVRPTHRVLDYNTNFTGLSEADLSNVTTTLADVQRDLLAMFSSKSILIGHSIDSDLKALKIIHRTCIDTVHLYPHRRGQPYRMSLKMLMQQHLNERIQAGDFHTGEEDARAAFRLVLKKAGLL